MITTILFDLDGTLLPMEMNKFIKAYLDGLGRKGVSHGYDPENMPRQIMASTAAMVKNDGTATNEDVFWDAFSALCGRNARADRDIFEDFYRNEFQQLRLSCGFDPRAAETIREIKAMGYRVALATNPLFPAIATHSRVRWAGLEPADFELITTYEHSCHAKPNSDYYHDVAKSLDVAPEECLMVGNDVVEDMIAEKVGMHVFLLTDCLINKENKNIDQYPRGSFPELMAYIKRLKR
jgi:HAD superfamily hydrolase (TIGR01549 family)